MPYSPTPLISPPPHPRFADAILSILGHLSSLGIQNISVQSSVSLQHLPWDIKLEPELKGGSSGPLPSSGGGGGGAGGGRPEISSSPRGLTADLRPRLAFARQKLASISAACAAAAFSYSADQKQDPTLPHSKPPPASALKGVPGCGGSWGEAAAVPADWSCRSEVFVTRRPKQVGGEMGGNQMRQSHAPEGIAIMA